VFFVIGELAEYLRSYIYQKFEKEPAESSEEEPGEIL